MRDMYAKLERMDETQASRYDIIVQKIEDELDGSRAETTQLRDMVRKTLDAQQLLGKSIVSLQIEMDSRLESKPASSNCGDKMIRKSMESFREQVEADLRRSELEVGKLMQDLVNQLTKSENHIERLSKVTCSSVKQLVPHIHTETIILFVKFVRCLATTSYLGNINSAEKTQRETIANNIGREA